MIEHRGDDDDHQDEYAFLTRIEGELLKGDRVHERVFENRNEFEKVDP